MMPRQSRQNSKPFKGDLAKPILIPTAPIPPTLIAGALEEEVKAEHQQKMNLYKEKIENLLEVEYDRKLDLLFDHYSISKGDPDCWEHLSRCLAVNLVSGFNTKVKEKIGRNKEWDSIRLTKLFIAIERYMDTKDKKVTVDEACKVLIKQSPWKQMSIEPKTLVNRYVQAKESPFSLAYLTLSKTKDHKGMKEYVSMIDYLSS